MKQIAYCKNCASILFVHYHNYTVDIQKTHKWRDGCPDSIEFTPAAEDYRDGSTFDECPLCTDQCVFYLRISDEVSDFLKTFPEDEGAISLELTEEELDEGCFVDLPRLKKIVAQQLLKS